MRIVYQTSKFRELGAECTEPYRKVAPAKGVNANAFPSLPIWRWRALKSEAFHCEMELPVLVVWFHYGLEDKGLPFIAKAPAFCELYIIIESERVHYYKKMY